MKKGLDDVTRPRQGISLMGTFQLAIRRPLVRAGVKNAHVLLDAFNGRTHTSAAGWVKGYQLPVVSEFCFAGTLAQKEARGAALYLSPITIAHRPEQS